MNDESEYPPVLMSQSHIAKEFAKSIAGKWCYAHDYKRWFFFNNIEWQMDTTCKIKRVVETFCNSAIYWPEASSLTPNEKKRMTQLRYFGDILSLAICHELIASSAEEIGWPPKKRNYRGRYPCP